MMLHLHLSESVKFVMYISKLTANYIIIEYYSHYLIAIQSAWNTFTLHIRTQFIIAGCL